MCNINKKFVVKFKMRRLSTIGKIKLSIYKFTTSTSDSTLIKLKDMNKKPSFQKIKMNSLGYRFS